MVTPTHLATTMVIEAKCLSIPQIQNGLWPFNDFTKSRRPFWNYVLEIEREPDPPSISGYADGHRVQMYASITNTEQVAILMIP